MQSNLVLRRQEIIRLCESAETRTDLTVSSAGVMRLLSEGDGTWGGAEWSTGVGDRGKVGQQEAGDGDGGLWVKQEGTRYRGIGQGMGHRDKMETGYGVWCCVRVALRLGRVNRALHRKCCPLTVSQYCSLGSGLGCSRERITCLEEF